MSVSAIIELGREIEAAWQARDYALSEFPSLCAKSLREAALPNRVRLDDVVRWTLASELPRQFDPKARFGQPPITVFRSRRFVIDVLFWIDGTTAIHDHGFSGAFQVLEGSSIETTFAFSVSRDVDGRFKLGRLGVTATALRRQGDVVPVAAGPSYIHSLFHLARPSVSLVIRTFWDPSPGIQFRYYPSGIAHDQFFEDEVRDRQVQVIEMLRHIEHPEFGSLVGDLIATTDANTSFAIIEACRHLRDERLQESLIARVRDPHVARAFSQWLADDRRLKVLRRARVDVRDPDLRFLLAVLMNAQRRVDAMALVAGYLPDSDPASQTAEWLRRLSTFSLRLQIGNAAWEPNVLGLPAFEEGFEEVLADALAGRPEPQGQRQREFLKQLSALAPLAPLFA